MRSDYIAIAISDITSSIHRFNLAWFLAWEDIRQRYVRTLLGPLWIVLSTAIWFGVMGFVMANLFGQSLKDYLPFMTSGLLVWVLISTSINEASQVLIGATPIIKSFPIPIFTHYIRFILRNYIIFLHNVLILALVLCLYPPHFDMDIWLVLPGLLLNMIILLNVSIVLSLTNLRYRDTHMAVASAMQILPFVTPIFWERGMLQHHRWIADINPLYHMVEIVRAPILGQAPSAISWIATIGLAVLSVAAASSMFVRYRHRIIFWL